MTSPLFAAMVNAASSHISEQDDVHNGSVFHPAAVVFPAALAVAQHLGASGRDFIAASVAGYEVGIRVGEFLGRSHYRVFHTTGTAGPSRRRWRRAGCSASTRPRCCTRSARQGRRPPGSGSSSATQPTQAASYGEGRRRRPDRRIPRQRWLHRRRGASWKASKAGGRHVQNADPANSPTASATRWALLETSFKFHASCRHTHPAADALLRCRGNDLRPDEIDRVAAHVHQAALDVLGPVTNPATVHQGKFSMPATLGLIAVHRRAGMAEFDGYARDGPARRFLDCVAMGLDPEIDAAYPSRWIGKVSVTTKDGRVIHGQVDEPKGDPGNTLSRDKMTQRRGGSPAMAKRSSDDELDPLMRRLWSITELDAINRLI